MIRPAPDRWQDVNQPLEEQLANWLVDYDEHLRAGTQDSAPKPDLVFADASTPVDLSNTLDELEEFWPRGQRPSAASSEPARIGRFEIERTLGHGGFGIVYLALDPALGRHVALNVPRLHALADAGLLDRFRREARAAAALDHPNIVPVHETGQVGSLYYIASAYCPGPNLAQWLKQQSNPVDPRLTARLIACLAEAVHYSHTRGVLHRDIKPGNVLLVPHAEQHAGDELPFTPRLTDFGLAKLVEQTLAEATLHSDAETATKQVLGTPAYMAPEQAGGRPADPIGPACDVYSLGAVLYELLAGRPPFAGPNIADILNQVLRDEVAPLRRLRRSVPHDLETICLKCLEKDPQRRYFSAQQLADDLHNYLSNRPILARRPSVPARVTKWSRRHPTVLWSAIAILLTATVALSLATLLVSRARTEAVETTKKLGTALKEKESALNERQSALDHEAETARRLYPFNMASAQNLITNGEFDFARELLTRYAPGAATAERRGFEWRHLWSLANRAHGRVLQGHTDYVFSVSFSPDRRHLASAGGDATVRIWDVRTGIQTFQFQAHPFHVNCVVYAPDGRSLATASDDHTIALWDPTTGERRATLRGHHDCVHCIAFSPDGRVLASGSIDGELRTWDCESGQALANVRGHEQRIRSIAISPDGGRLASVASEPVIRIWDLATLALRVERHVHEAHELEAISFDSQSDQLVAVQRDSRMILLNGQTGEVIEERSRPGRCFDVEFARDRDAIAIVGVAPATVLLSGPDRLEAVYNIDSRNISWCTAHTRDGRYLAAGCHHDVVVWDVKQPPSHQTLALYPNGAYCVACSRANGQFAVGIDGSVRLLDLAERREVRSFATDGRVRTCQFSPDGTLLATGGEAGVRIYDPDTHEVLRVLRELDGPVLDLGFSPNGRLFAACDGVTARTWDTATWEVAGTWADNAVRHVAYSCDNRIILGEAISSLTIWYLIEGQRPESWKCPDRGGTLDPSGRTMGTSADGTWLAAGYQDGKVGLWDIRSFHASGDLQMTVLSGHRYPDIVAAAFSRDHRTLATADLSGELILWDIASGAAMLKFDLVKLVTRPSFGGHYEGIDLEFAPDDSALIAVVDTRVTESIDGHGAVFVLHAPHVDELSR